MSRWGMRPLLAVGIAGAALLLAALSIRGSSTRAPRSHTLASFAYLWPAHPNVAVEQLFVDAAVAARASQSLDSNQRARLRNVATRAPLEPQPFMLEGAVAQLEGDTARALRLYHAARRRDPRDPAARLLLADLELRHGLVEQGLGNLVAITRIEQGKAAPVLPAIVEYVQAPGAVGKVRRVFARHPILADAVLTQLAADPRNAPLIRSLAPAKRGAGVAAWEQRLIETMLASGDPLEARRLWLGFNRIGSGAGDLPFNQQFRPLPAGPPFNWTVASGRAGLAEIRPSGGLAIVHFGREPIVLARQLLVLEPGRYAVDTAIDGRGEPGRLEWRLQCLTGGEPQILDADSRATFQASPACRAHWLELHAAPDGSEQQIERTVIRVELRKVG